jgi:hypothetical protein
MTSTHTNLQPILRGKPFQRGHDPRRNLAKGGRPTDEFVASMRSLASSNAVLSTLADILTDKDHPSWMKAFAYCADRGFGKATQPVEVTTSGQSISEILRKGRDRVARMKAEAEERALVEVTDRSA